MARLVPALPGEFHPESPRSVGEFDEALGRDVEAGDLVGHVPMDRLAAREQARALGSLHLRVGEDDLETGVAGRRRAQLQPADLDEADRAHTATATIVGMASARRRKSPVAAEASPISPRSRSASRRWRA